MQLKVLTLTVFAAAMLASPVSFADDKRVAQCVEDNKDEGQAADVVSKYCACMDGKMGASETQTITAWEESHEDEADACDDESGWKDD